MCTYLTEHVALAGSAKGPDGWFRLTDATVYLDHPYHAPYEHALAIDFVNPAVGPAARVAVELDPEAARELAAAIVRMLDAVSHEHTSSSASAPAPMLAARGRTEYKTEKS